MLQQDNSGAKSIKWVSMTTYLGLLALILVAGATYAEGKEKYATTDDGFRIRINANGTWSTPSTKLTEITGAFELTSGRGFFKYLLIEKTQTQNTYRIRWKRELIDEDWSDLCTSGLHAGKLQGSENGADVDITHEDSRMLLKLGKAHMTETGYYRRINIQELTREAEERAAKEAKRWGPDEGQMNWTDATNLCRQKGMRLPNVEELRMAGQSGAWKLWKRQSSNAGSFYWSSIASEKGYMEVHELGKEFDSESSSVISVRCRE